MEIGRKGRIVVVCCLGFTVRGFRLRRREQDEADSEASKRRAGSDWGEMVRCK